MKESITVERVRHALVVGRLDEDGAAVLLAANLPPKRDRTYVVVGASSLDAMTRLDPWVVADLADEVHGDLCVVAPRFGSMGSDGALPPARLLADRLGVEVTAADGDPVGLGDGSVYVPGPSAGWVSFRPGGRRVRVGARYPAPWWQEGLPEPADHLTHLPAGLWVRVPGGPERPDDPLLRRVPDPDRMYVVLGAPGERPPTPTTVAEVLRSLPDEGRDRAVLAWYGSAGAAREVVAELGAPVRVAHGVPGAGGLGYVDEAGVLRWRPFAVESVYRVSGPPVLDRWVAPPGLAMAEPASYRLTDDWRVDVVARGLAVRPETLRLEAAVAAETGPSADLVFATDGPVADEVLSALDRLIRALPTDTRRNLRVLPMGEHAAAALATVPAVRDVATAALVPEVAPTEPPPGPVGSVMVTADGRIMPTAPILTLPAPPVPIDIRDGVLTIPLDDDPVAEIPSIAPTTVAPTIAQSPHPAARTFAVSATGTLDAPTPPEPTPTTPEPTPVAAQETIRFAPVPAPQPPHPPAPRSSTAPPEPTPPPDLAPPAALPDTTMPPAPVNSPAPPALVNPPAPLASVNSSLPPGSVNSPAPLASVNSPMPPASVNPPLPSASVNSPVPSAPSIPAALFPPPDPPVATAPNTNRVAAAEAPPTAPPVAPAAAAPNSASPGPAVSPAAPESTAPRDLAFLAGPPPRNAPGHPPAPLARTAPPAAATRTAEAETAPAQPTTAPAPVASSPTASIPSVVPAVSARPAMATTVDSAVESVTGLLPVRNVPTPTSRPIEVPADARSTAEQRRAMRGRLGARYDVATRAVTQLLSERPGLRFGSGDRAALLTELAVVRVFAGDPTGDYDADFYTCLADGLRRLPTARTVAVRGIPADTDLRPETILRLPVPVVAAPPGAGPAGPAEALIWTTTARRLDGLLDDEPADTGQPIGGDVVLSGHTRLRVLAVEENRVLLAEDGTAPEPALVRLRAVAGTRPALEDTQPPVSRWFGPLPAA